MDKFYLVRFDIMRQKDFHARFRFVRAKNAKEARTQFDADWGYVRHGNVPYPYHLTVKPIRPDDEKTMALPGRPLVAKVTVNRVERKSPTWRTPRTDTKECKFIVSCEKFDTSVRLEYKNGSTFGGTTCNWFNLYCCEVPFTVKELDEFIPDHLYKLEDKEMVVSGYEINWEV